jgi:hypothetical protein
VLTDTPPSVGAPNVDGGVGPARRSTSGEPKRLHGFVRWSLFTTVLLGGLLAVILAVRDAQLTHSAASTLGSAMWLTAGVVNLVAAYAIVGRYRVWLVSSVVGQLFVALLALYVWIIDLRSPMRQLTGLSGVALVIGGIAVAWVCVLVRHVPRSIHRGVAAVVVLFPLLGLFQLWYETDYVPRNSTPMVDIQVALKEVGRTGSTIHLEADLTLHNRGSAEADSIGSLLRITEYARSTKPQEPSANAVARAMDEGLAARDFRAEPLPTSGRHLLYADDFFPVGGSFLTPGETDTFHIAVDVDASAASHVKLSADVGFIAQRDMGSIHTCTGRRVDESDPQFLARVTKPTDYGGFKFLCVETDLEPRNVVQDLVADHPSIRTYIYLSDPGQPDAEFPQFAVEYGTGGSFNSPSYNRRIAQSINAANPTGIAEATDEFVVGDAATP